MLVMVEMVRVRGWWVRHAVAQRCQQQHQETLHPLRHRLESLHVSLGGPRDAALAKKHIRQSQRKKTVGTKSVQASEADRHISIKKPKWLLSGKRGRGSTDYR